MKQQTQAKEQQIATLEQGAVAQQQERDAAVEREGALRREQTAALGVQLARVGEHVVVLEAQIMNSAHAAKGSARIRSRSRLVMAVIWSWCSTYSQNG